MNNINMRDNRDHDTISMRPIDISGVFEKVKSTVNPHSEFREPWRDDDARTLSEDNFTRENEMLNITSHITYTVNPSKHLHGNAYPRRSIAEPCHSPHIMPTKIIDMAKLVFLLI